MLLKRVQLGLIHMAVAITLVPINSTLNRIMIKELAISATVVALLVSLPYILSPIQMAIGSYADRHPIFGRRRTPYIVLGLLLCVAGALLAPYAAFELAEARWVGVALSILAFGMWGMGYNLSAVSYLSLASEIDPQGRSRTIATMFTLMIIGIILTAVMVGRMVDPYTPQALIRAFWFAQGAALVLGLIGLVRLEKPVREMTAAPEKRHSWREMSDAVFSNRQARLFFWYLLLLLAAILGQDVLLEPYGGEAFGLTPSETTRITQIWGVCFLITLVMAGVMQSRFSKRTVALVGNWMALISFAIVSVSGLLGSSAVFFSGVVLLGLGSGLSTVSNLSLMLDMTTPANVGLFVGAWGVANALSRLAGQVLSGVVKDMVTLALGDAVLAYVTVFALLVVFLGIALLIFRSIDVAAFQRGAGERVSLVEAAALMHEAQS